MNFLTNTGTVSIIAGTLNASMTAGTTSTGSFNANSGTTLNSSVDNGVSHTLAIATTFVGSGVVSVNNGGGAANIAAARALVLAGRDNQSGYFSPAATTDTRIGYADTGTGVRSRLTLDGGVSINDFNLLAGQFGKTLAAPGATADLSGLLAFAAAHDDLAAFEAVTGVPEPTAATVSARPATLTTATSSRPPNVTRTSFPSRPTPSANGQPPPHRLPLVVRPPPRRPLRGPPRLASADHSARSAKARPTSSPVYAASRSLQPPRPRQDRPAPAHR